jgi:hypothetical protein
MLFFAVFCGFLAENIREHKVHQQPNNLLYPCKHLKADTAALNTAIGFGNKKIKAVDSLIAQIEQPKKMEVTDIHLQVLEEPGHSGTIRVPRANEASGSLRYFKRADRFVESI